MTDDGELNVVLISFVLPKYLQEQLIGYDLYTKLPDY